jgi:Fanconi anemia group M protein
MTEPELIVNSRDRGSQLIPKLEKEGLAFAFSQLKYVDFLIAGRIAIIRRKTEDFAEDLKTKMLYRTLPFFKREYTEPLYIVEGESLMVNGTPMPAIRSGITHITSVSRIPIIRTRDSDETARYLSLLVKQAQFSAPAEPRQEVDEDDSQPVPWQVAMLEHLPDVDRVIATRLLKQFGSIRGVLNAEVSALQKIKGLGPKKSEKIKRALAAQVEDFTK